VKHALALVALLLGCGGPASAPPPTPAAEPARNASGCRSDDLCVEPYRAFVTKATAFGRPLDAAALDAQLAAITADNTNTVQERPSSDALREGLIEATNLAPLIADLRPRAPALILGPPVERDGLLEQTARIDDPWVGSIEAVLYLPPGRGPVPGVLAHPGHGEGPAEHFARRGGKELVASGIGLLIVRPRAHAGDETSAALARELLLAGHPLVGLRTYEVLVAAKALAAHPRIERDRIGFHGHSGGSVVGHIAVRVDNGFAAFAGDLTSTYGVPGAEPGAISDETAPALYPWHPWLEEPSTSTTPILQEEYGFPDGVQRPVEFLVARLTR